MQRLARDRYELLYSYASTRYSSKQSRDAGQEIGARQHGISYPHKVYRLLVDEKLEEKEQSYSILGKSAHWPYLSTFTIQTVQTLYTRRRLLATVQVRQAGYHETSGAISLLFLRNGFDRMMSVLAFRYTRCGCCQNET